MRADRTLLGPVKNQPFVMMVQSVSTKTKGIQIDAKLNFTSHIIELCTKASHNVGVLLRLRSLIPCNAKLSLSKSSI